MTDAKTELRWYLQSARDALLWKLDGLSEYDVRRPLTPTGTNLLGLVKHASYVESGYLADSFGRPSGLKLPWLGGAEPSANLWVADQSRASIIDGYRRAWTLADATLDELPLDTVGAVPWWPADDNALTLHHALVRVLSDTQRQPRQHRPRADRRSSRNERRQRKPADEGPRLVAGPPQPGGGCRALSKEHCRRLSSLSPNNSRRPQAVGHPTTAFAL